MTGLSASFGKSSTMKDLMGRMLVEEMAGDFDLRKTLQLINDGASLEARDAQGNTPLIISIITGAMAVTGFLLDKGANIEARSHGSGATPLIFAVLHGNAEAVGTLLSRGASPDETDRDGHSAKDYAAHMAEKFKTDAQAAPRVQILETVMLAQDAGRLERFRNGRAKIGAGPVTP